jgi:hypothetical protein
MFIHKKHGDMLLSAVLSALVFIMLAGSFFTLFSGQFTRIQAGRTAMQAEQYAEIDTNTLRLLSYDDLDSKGAHARQGITSVADADGWQDEIVVGAEKTIDVTTESKQRIATIKIYKTGDTLSRYSLQVPLSSQGSGASGVPVGSIIAWALDSMPAGNDSGKWLECNGQTVDAAIYPKLSELMSNVPDYQGVFLRGYGSQTYTDAYGSIVHQSGALGEIQGDSIRNIVGSFSGDDTQVGNVTSVGYIDGVFYKSKNLPGYDFQNTNSGPGGQITFSTDRVVPTANENRPINKAVRYLIKGK